MGQRCTWVRQPAHPDGNCGYRAVSLAVFDNKIAWIQTYELNEAYTSKNLQSTRAPCLDDLSLWFDCYGCPQIVADTFKRPVFLHAITPKVDKYDITWKDNDGNIIYTKDSITFVPLLGLDLEIMNNPIQLLFANSRFYVILPQIDNKTKKAFKVKKWPTLNFSHHKIFDAHRDICVNDVSNYFQNN
ncbi:hypothetical protein INT47_006277 [Mucor saturninus]|uniref:YTH domain-containing protein n=1 Tax=Mucor saturninus TaxID=64648 RepID=A0A8H7RIG5_9FUNG|nr:hypothetical protein INT47_006277 [Mucor saturninus]